MRGWTVAALAAASCAFMACGDKITNIYGSGGSGSGGSTSSLATSTGAGATGGGSSSTDATTGQGGATTGQGGASATTGAGGMGGDGGGQGGAGGCTPNGIACDSLPAGQCEDVDDGCGVVDCSKSCDDPNLYCLPSTKLCDCQIATGYSDAIAKCPGSTPYFCGAGSADVPADCADTGAKVFGDEVWCCQH